MFMGRRDETAVLTARVENELAKATVQRAEQLGTSRNEFITQALQAHLERTRGARPSKAKSPAR